MRIKRGSPKDFRKELSRRECLLRSSLCSASCCSWRCRLRCACLAMRVQVTGSLAHACCAQVGG